MYITFKIIKYSTSENDHGFFSPSVHHFSWLGTDHEWRVDEFLYIVIGEINRVRIKQVKEDIHFGICTPYLWHSLLNLELEA